MNYFDPARPRLANGALRYLDSTGKDVGALQDLRIEHLDQYTDDGEPMVEVCLFLVTNPGCGRWFSAKCPLTQSLVWLAEYRDDPEKFMRQRLGWTDPSPGEEILRREIVPKIQNAGKSVDELGL